jgi:hypothetical protein
MANDEFGSWIQENCVVDADARVALKQLVLESGMPEKKVKENMKRLGFVYNKELKGCGKDSTGKYYKGGYEGIKINDKVEETFDMEEEE